ncbi:MAG: hypothetical protein J0L84_18490, partial [Verrucomicrobia bacterium]|nr:hypothetical protein [Verrucomicrobiota bacterium]
MPSTPKKDRRAQTGSNLRGNPLHAHRVSLWSQRSAPFKRLAREYQRQVRALFSKAELQVAANLAATVQAEWRRAALQAGGEAAKIASLKDAARRKLDRLLARTLPSYRKLQALRRTSLREHQRIHTRYHAGLPHDQVHVNIGDVAPSDPADGKMFTSPFPLFAVSQIDEGGIVAEDES